MDTLPATIVLLLLAGCGDKLVDVDGDGYLVEVDCDDADATIYPGADELCDGVDSDCDGVVDDDPVEGEGEAVYLDYDGDGYGNPEFSARACGALSGYVADSTDCDDLHAEVYPGNVEVCDALDNDCDGNVDTGAGDVTLFYADGDGDGYGNPAQSTQACFAPSGYVDNGADCDDTDAQANPESRWYADLDGDGYGATTFVVVDCEAPSGYVSDGSDCDDENVDINPGAEEICDGKDSNCDGTVPKDDTDNDSDGQAPCAGDCDDTNSDILLGAEEVCGDGIDDDCNGIADNTCPASVTDADLTLIGENASDNFGISLAAGDVDSDGAADLLVGAYGNDDTASAAGKAYLFFGPVTTTDSADADATFVGAAQSDYLGYTAALGDLDGDGYGDVIVGAYGASTGAAYVFYGPVSGAYDTGDASAVITGAGTSSDLSRYLLSAADDIDGDGNADLVVGAHSYNSNKGAVGVFSAPSGDQDIDDADILFQGTATTGYAGYGGGAVGDVNGDGVPDVGFGEPNANQAYLYYGGVSGTLDGSGADIVFDNTDRGGDYPGSRVDGGDLNGDGSDDVVISIKYDDITYTSTGTIAVFLSPSSSSIDMYDADFLLHGASTYMYLGQQTDGLTVTDIDGDGTDDLIFGASSDDSLYTNAGGAFIFYGPLTGSADTDGFDRGFFGDSSYQYTGRTSVIVEDLDGDSTDDLVFGAYGAGSFSGRAYLFSGTSL